MEMHENIKFRREELGLSQDQLAKKVGYSDRSSITKIETVKVDLPYSKILELSYALYLSPIQLMGLDESACLAPEIVELAETIKARDDLRCLIDKAKGLSAEDLKFVNRIVETLK